MHTLVSLIIYYPLLVLINVYFVMFYVPVSISAIARRNLRIELLANPVYSWADVFVFAAIYWMFCKSVM